MFNTMDLNFHFKEIVSATSLVTFLHFVNTKYARNMWMIDITKNVIKDSLCIAEKKRQQIYDIVDTTTPLEKE